MSITHRWSLAVAGLLLAACQADQPTEAQPSATPPRAPTGSTAFLITVYDTAMDISGVAGQSHAYGISDAGLIVGDVNGLPFTWQQPTGPRRLLPLPANLQSGGTATGISPAGKYITGAGNVTYSGPTHAMLWDGVHLALDLGTLGGANSWGNAVDDKGTVVGWSETVRGIMHAFRYTRSSGMVDLGILPGSYRTAQMQAWDLNGTQIVGCGNGPTGSYDMWSWTAAGGLVDLGTGAGFTCADAVNAKSVIAGASDQFGGFTWTRAGGFIYPVGGSNVAHDINVNGVSVGEANGYSRAYVADPRGAVTLLPSLVQYPAPSSASAWAINACGDVVGWSNNPFLGETHAVWWPGHQCP